VSRASRRAKQARRRAAKLHPMSESLELAFDEVEQPAPPHGFNAHLPAGGVLIAGKGNRGGIA
jgi:hypothetical protein